VTDPAADLIDAARAGDQDALERLARWCYPVVRRWALLHTGDEDEADDVTQETISALHGRLGAFRGDSRFSTWLFRVTANVAGTRQRASRRRLGILRRWWLPASHTDPRPLERMHHRHLQVLVHRLLVELPPQQRLVFDLADLQQIDYAEIARMLEIDVATVRSHLMRARRTMRLRMLERLPTLAEDHP